MSKSHYSVFRDPVHGDVYLTREEVSLLDTPQMQRLRGVRQLGSAYLVYPGANHTRFEHSIGTLWMVQRIIDTINRNASLHPALGHGVRDDETRLIRMAALVHDVTHIPFGHNIEDQTGLFERHDTRARYEERFDGTPLGDRLSQYGARDEVLETLVPPPGGPPRVPPYWSDIISGTIGADILDYLRRDAYFTGLNLYYDSRIVNYFKVQRSTETLYIDAAKNDMLREDIASEIVRILEARFYFSERVYYHHAKISAGALVAKAVEHAIRSGAARESDFYDQTDDTLTDFLSRLIYPKTAVRDRVRLLLRMLRTRELPKRCCVYPVYENRDQQDAMVEAYFAKGSYATRAAKEDAIAERVKSATGQEVLVLLYCPARKMQLKEAGIRVRVPGRPDPIPMHELKGTLTRTADLSDAYRDLWKFYVFASPGTPEVCRAVAQACEKEMPELVNAYFVP